MRTRVRQGLAAVASLLAVVLMAPGCGWNASPPADAPTTTPPPKPAALKDEIPPDKLAAFTAAHQEGVGYMERYDYHRAAESFRRAHELAPGLSAATINLAIAILNDTGTEAEKSKAKGGDAQVFANKFDEAIALLTSVLDRDPDNLYARYCRGIILAYQAQTEEAHADFQYVLKKDPSDPHAWLQAGATLPMPAERGVKAMRAQADELVRYYTESLKRNPYNAVAMFRLSMAYSRAGKPDQYAAMNKLWTAMNPEQDPKAPGDSGQTTYGEMGRYATIIDPFSGAPIPAARPLPPKFDAPKPAQVALAEGDRWAKAGDFSGTLAPLGRARARFGAAVAAFDADGDLKLDLYLASAIVGPKGVRDALLINKGDGTFEDASRRFGLPEDRASLAVAAGDFDADRYVDVFATGIGERRLLRNVAGEKFADVSDVLPPMGEPAISPVARWMDLDQDGDLDLYIANFAPADRAESAFAEGASPGLKNAAYRNDGVPPTPPNFGGAADTLAPVAVAKGAPKDGEGLSVKFAAWDTPEAAALLGEAAPHTGIAVLDLDNDRDLDLVLTADGRPASAILNDRLGRFHAAPVTGLDEPKAASGLLVMDLDEDGRSDLVAPSASGPAVARRNVSTRDKEGAVTLAFEPFPLDGKGWRSAGVADVDLDGTLDLLALPGPDATPAPIFARGEVKRLAASPLVLPPGPPAGGGANLQGLAYADVIGEPLPDVVMIPDGGPPVVAANLGNGHHWLGLEIGGRWDVKPKTMRTNVEGLGARIVVEGDGLRLPLDYTTLDSGPAQSVTPIVVGLGPLQKARLVRVRWPDGVLQAELDEDADRLLPLVENNRKEGSCPVLFTWNGTRMICLGDFLGGGGLGYLVAPGEYGQPDRDEAVAIGPDQLAPANGSYRMSITEPMSELAYLDKLTLDVWTARPA